MHTRGEAESRESFYIGLYRGKGQPEERANNNVEPLTTLMPGSVFWAASVRVNIH